MSLQRFITVFTACLTPSQKIFHSLGDFFRSKQQQNETLEQYWKKLCELEKDFEFKNTRWTHGIKVRYIHYGHRTTEQNMRPTKNNAKINQGPDENRYIR